MFLVSSSSRICPIHWTQALSWEWRCNWSSADRRCFNYIWVNNNFIAYLGAPYIRDLTVMHFHQAFILSHVGNTDAKVTLVRLATNTILSLFRSTVRIHQRRCSWSNADRLCYNYIWVIDKLITYEAVAYIKYLTVRSDCHDTLCYAHNSNYLRYHTQPIISCA